MKITNESAFIRECVVLKLLTFFKPSFSVISDIIKFDNGLAKQYNELDFDKYFDKRISATFYKKATEEIEFENYSIYFSEKDAKKITKIVYKIRNVIIGYQNSGVYTDLVEQNKEGKMVGNIANTIYNFYVLYWLNKFALKLNFYKNVETAYIQEFVEILTEFEGVIYNYFDKENGVDKTWETFKDKAFFKARQLLAVFKDIMPA